MSSLWDEVQNLKATMKQWEIVTLNKSGSSYPFDSKYADWNFLVLVAGSEYRSDVTTEYKVNYNSYSGKMSWSTSGANKYSVSYSQTFNKSGNTIKIPYTYEISLPATITVLFYK